MATDDIYALAGRIRDAAGPALRELGWTIEPEAIADNPDAEVVTAVEALRETGHPLSVQTRADIREFRTSMDPRERDRLDGALGDLHVAA